MKEKWFDALKQQLPKESLCSDEEATKRRLTDWRGRFHGACRVHFCPATPQEISTILAFCHKHHVQVTPQGGNTGLCGGATPDKSENNVLISFERMRNIRHYSQAGDYMIAEAGCKLVDLQEEAEKNNHFFPLQLAAAEECTIGGNLATNAGGTRVLRYGNCRDLVLGIEAVLPCGRMINDLSTLRKNNSGYDLKNLLIGSEGTLGIITAMSLKLFPKQRSSSLAFIAVASPDEALVFFQRLREEAYEWLSTFDILPLRLIEETTKMLGKASPLSVRSRWLMMIELSASTEKSSCAEQLETLAGKALKEKNITEAAFARTPEEYRFFWQLRAKMVLAQKNIGFSIKHDIALPLEKIPNFIALAEKAVKENEPNAEPCPFGHLGDGNLHYNIFLPVEKNQEEKIRRLNTIIYDMVHDFGGTISAEHGIGLLKRNLLPLYKDAGALDMMRCIKKAIDPHGIMNPGKILSL